MNSTWTALENSTGEIKVSTQGDIWKKAQEQAFKKLAKKVKIAGFRSGKAPLDMVKKQIEENSVLMEAAEDVAGELLMEALKEHDLTLVARPELKIDGISKEKADFTFNCTVKPDVTLGEYRSLQVTREEVKVEDSQIDQQIEIMRENYAELVLKEEGEAKEGDTVVIDFKGFLDNEEFEGGTADNYPLEIGSHSFIPGFEEQLIGIKSGDKKDIEVTFPEDYQAENLAGKPVVFKVEAKEIKEKILPLVDDDFAKSLNMKDVTNLAELRQSVYDRLLAQAERSTEDKFRNTLITTLLDNCACDIPTVMTDQESEYLHKKFNDDLSQQGFSEELYCQYTGQTPEAMHEQFQREAVNKVKLRLVLGAIAKKEELTVEAVEVDKEYEEIAAKYKVELSEVIKLIDRQDLEDDIKMRKAMEIVETTAGK